VFSSKTLRIVLRKGRVPFLLLFAIATYLVPRLSFLPGIQGIQSVAQSWNLIAQVLTDLEQRCIDYHFLLRGPVPQNPGVVLLGVERTDFQASDFREEDVAASEGLRLLLEKPYPWNRKLWALLVDKLAAAGVKAVAFDFLFEPENPGDPDFRAALDRHPGLVILGVSTAQTADGNGLRFLKPNPTLVPDQESPLHGFVAYHAEPGDNVIRRYDLHTSEIRELLDPSDTAPQYRCFAPYAASKAGAPLPNQPFRNLIPFSGPAKTIVPIPVEELFIERIFQSDPRFAGGAALKDKIVFVGPVAELFRDVHNTPWGVMPGVEIHAQLASALLSGQGIRDATELENLCLGIAFALLPALTILIVRSAAFQAILLAGLATLFLAGSHFLFLQHRVLVPTVPAFLSVVSIGTFGIVYTFLLELVERRRIRSVLDRHVSKNIAKKVIEQADSFENALRGERRMVTALFSDVRGFTSIFESADAETLVTQLNEYFHDMVDAVEKHDGTLQKFIGDAIMAVWGDTHTAGPAADSARAIRCALLMRDALANLNARWRTQPDRLQLQIGIGINHGEVIVGEIGHPRRMEFTALGDAVNLASRLEGATKLYGCDILVGEKAFELTRAEFVFRRVDRLRVKGKAKPVEVFAPLSSAAIAPPAWLARYHEALELYYATRFTEAAEGFRAVLSETGDDYLCSLYLDRCAEFISTPPPQGWDGVHTLTSK
jgi:adenylate cyclase